MKTFCGIIALAFLSMGCGSSSNDSKPAPPPLKKLEPEQKAEAFSYLNAQIRTSFAQQVLDNPNSPIKIGDDTLNRMREMLVEGGCVAKKEEVQGRNKLETYFTITGTNCPISESANSTLSLVDQTTLSAIGALSFEVRNAEYAKLSDITAIVATGDGVINFQETATHRNLALTANFGATVRSQTFGTVPTSAGISMNSSTLKDNSDGAVNLNVWERMTLRDYVAEFRIQLKQEMGKDTVEIKVWINGEELEVNADHSVNPAIFADLMNQKSIQPSKLMQIKNQILASVIR